jgi:hypothetical protein
LKKDELDMKYKTDVLANDGPHIKEKIAEGSLLYPKSKLKHFINVGYNKKKKKGPFLTHFITLPQDIRGHASTIFVLKLIIWRLELIELTSVEYPTAVSLCVTTVLEYLLIYKSTIILERR